MGFRSSCVQAVYRRMVLQYGEGVVLAKANVNDKLKRELKEHTSKMIL